jgi:hypothetical protein
MQVGELCVRLSSIRRLTRRGRGALGARYRLCRKISSGLRATVAGRRWHAPNTSPRSVAPSRSRLTLIKPWYSPTWGWSALQGVPNAGALLSGPRSEPAHASRSPARLIARFARNRADSRPGSHAIGAASSAHRRSDRGEGVRRGSAGPDDPDRGNRIAGTSTQRAIALRHEDSALAVPARDEGIARLASYGCRGGQHADQRIHAKALAASIARGLGACLCRHPCPSAGKSSSGAGYEQSVRQCSPFADAAARRRLTRTPGTVAARPERPPGRNGWGRPHP